MVVGGSGVAGHRNARLEQIALVGLILHRDPHRHRLQALKAGGRLKMGALFAAMQRGTAFGTFALPIDIGRERGGAVKTAGGHYVLEQPGKARAGDVDAAAGGRRA